MRFSHGSLRDGLMWEDDEHQTVQSRSYPSVYTVQLHASYIGTVITQPNEESPSIRRLSQWVTGSTRLGSDLREAAAAALG